MTFNTWIMRGKASKCENTKFWSMIGYLDHTKYSIFEISNKKWDWFKTWFFRETGCLFDFEHSILGSNLPKMSSYPKKSVFWIFTTMCPNYQDFKSGWSYAYWVWAFMLGWSRVCFFTFYLNPPERTVV